MMRLRSLGFLIIALLVTMGITMAGDINHPSYPNAVHYGEPLVNGQSFGNPMSPSPPEDISDWVGPVSITGNQANGADQISHVNINGTCNPDTFGAVHDGSTDDSAAFRSCVTQLGARGGTIMVSPFAYIWAAQVVFPRNVILTGQGPDTSQINCTATSGACAVWADGLGDGLYHRGGANEITINGSGSGHATIGVWTGGDPASVIVPSSDFGDSLTFFNTKVQNFGTGWEQGNNSWATRWYSGIFSANATGILIPSNNTDAGEGDSMYGGSIQNGTTGLYCDQPNADFILDGVSIDGMTGTAIENGDGTHSGCAVTASGSHIEYFNGQLHPLAVPIIYDYGTSAFTSLYWTGGVISLDDNSAPTIESIAKVTGGANGAVLTMDGLRINSGHPITFTGTCAYALTKLCIENDGSDTSFIVKSYNYWDASNNGTHQFQVNKQVAITDPAENLASVNFTNGIGNTTWWELNSGFNASDTQGNLSLYDALTGIYPLIIAPRTDNITIPKAEVNGVLNVQAYGADPTDTSDSTTAFNNAIAAACPRSGSTGFCKQAIYVPAGTYKVTQVNATNLFYFKMFGDAPIGAYAEIDCEEATNNTGICTDFSGDQYTQVDDLQWDTSSGHAPKALVLMAKTTVATFGNSQEHDWRNDGFFTTGGDYGLYNYGGEIWDCRMCNWNGTPNVAALFMSLVNTPNVTSPFATLSSGTSSMTTTNLDNVSLSSQNATAPLIINSGGASLDTFNVSGYCNTGLGGTGTPCIEDYTSTDTGGVTNFYMSNMRHESFGSSPGPLIDMRYGAIWGGNIKATWNPVAPTSGPAAIFGGLLNWSDINIFIYPGNETSYPVVCSGGNVLGDTIHVQYTNPGPAYLPNGCVGANIIDGVEGSGAGTLIRGWVYQSQVTALANFAACNAGQEGSFGRANNCSSTTLGTTCSGTGSTHAEVMCNGTNWIQLGY